MNNCGHLLFHKAIKSLADFSETFPINYRQLELPLAVLDTTEAGIPKC